MIHLNAFTQCSICPQSKGTHAEARRALFEYLELFYNRERRHSALGYLSPYAFEQHHNERTAA